MDALAVKHNVSWYVRQFPESLFTCPPDNMKNYASHVIYGREVMSRANIAICGLARDIKRVLPYTISRIEYLGSLFKTYKVFIYENDSTDGTVEDLKRWESYNNNVKVTAESLQIPRLAGANLERTKNLAYFRNQYMKEVDKTEFDFIIVLDTDLIGGFSYEGVCNSFGQADWDVMASNSILYTADEHNNVRRIYHDTWAFRKNDIPNDTKTIQDLKFNRGESIININSAFGGLAIYKHNVIKGLQYEGYDCEHVTLHQKILDNKNKIYINPSQITLYSPTRYNVL